MNRSNNPAPTSAFRIPRAREAIKQVLPKLFETDESSARPAGSMDVLKAIWWKHNCKSGQYSSAKVHQSLNVHPDGSYEVAALAGMQPEKIDGF